MRVPSVVAALAALALAPTALRAADEGGGEMIGTSAPTQEYLDQKAQLEAMINSRDMELYEMSFEPLNLDRVVLTTRTGKEVVFNYLTFRLRNQIADKTSTPLSKAKGYNDVLAAIQEQYAGIAKSVEDNGVKLQIEGVDRPEGTIVERQNAQIHQKKVSITVYGYDEHGTRIRLLDEPPGSGPQESFNFPDIGEPSWAAVAEKVKDKIEEKESRELWSLDKIRGLELPPYESSQIEKNGWAKGEVYGVAMFHRLSDYGDYFTFQVRGLSNKLRIHWPETEAGKVENYLDARFYRRVWVLHYERTGDEYFRDLDPFILKKSGWEWVNTFQRNEQRRSMAYARYFLENIANNSTPSPTANQTVEAEFWPYYSQVRQEHPAKPNAPVPDLEADLKSPGGR
jgi:hypothetical protein